MPVECPKKRHLTRIAADLESNHLASAGHEDVVRELLGAGADVKRTNDKGLTAL